MQHLLACKIEPLTFLLQWKKKNQTQKQTELNKKKKNEEKQSK